MDELKRGTKLLRNDYINAWSEPQLLFLTVVELTKNPDIAMEKVRLLLKDRKIENFWERYPGQQHEYYRSEILDTIGEINSLVDKINCSYHEMSAQEFAEIFLRVSELVCTPEKFREIRREFEEHGVTVSRGR